MKLIGNAASEKSTHAHTAFGDLLAGPDCVLPGHHTTVEITDLFKNSNVCAMPRSHGVPLLGYGVALT